MKIVNMIETGDLQTFLEKIQGGTIPVDLLKIGQAHYAQHASSASKSKYSGTHHGKFRIALDIEDCLDRFYGGYYSDWACGGQWNRAYEFVRLLVEAFNTAHIELIVFFDGCHRRVATNRQNEFRQKSISVLKHIRMIGTPPPKIWWLPPSGLRTCLRNALRALNILVIQTVHDHTMEVIDYFHEYKLDGILGLNPDYVIANTSKYYSSHDLRLSYKGALETKEYLVSKLLSNLSLTPDHLPFIAVFLGGYNLIDDSMLKAIYKQIKIDFAIDFEARIRKLAEIIRNSPTNEIDEFIRHLSLEEWSKELKESVEYFKRSTRFSNGRKFFSNKRKVVVEIQRINETTPTAPLASETNESDEVARKMLQAVSNFVDDAESSATTASTATNMVGAAASIEKSGQSDTTVKTGAISKKAAAAFVYALPGEVLRTSLNRHQRGIMDSRIYQLLTKKKLVLPQILEDEQHRDTPAIHLFYRPARQMIYAILFNLYHQKYLCSKTLSNTQSSQRSPIVPEVLVAEWIWSTHNEYKKAEMVSAVQLPWPVPTIQRLWFGMAFEDKQRRMKAFLTVMRSDTSLMLNRNYVPHHLLVLACVLRYIITSPDRKILTRLELDAFLATAFSPDIRNVEYTQELVLPGVHLRGVYLATLFMQGVETASLANDACGVPLPWVVTNPWLFFDGKLFHFKLKMSAYVPTLRDLCDNQIDTPLKVDRLRKAILEDAEHCLIPAHMDPLYRAEFYPSASLPQAYGGKNVIHAVTNIPQLSNGSASYYNSVIQSQLHPSQSSATNYFSHATARNCGNGNTRYSHDKHQQQQQQQQQQLMTGYQLKVGGVVVGSWAGGAPNRNNANGVQSRINRVAMAAAVAQSGLGGVGAFDSRLMTLPGLNGRNRANQVTARLQRNLIGHQHVASLGRTISRNTYGNNKVNRQRNRNRNRKNERKNAQKQQESDKQTEQSEDGAATSESDTVQDSNGTTTQVSNLAKSMCHDILKEEDDDDVQSLDDGTVDTGSDLLDEQNGNISSKFTNLSICDNIVNASGSIGASSCASPTLNGGELAGDPDKGNNANINNKKKVKKGTNNINNKILSTELEQITNDNKTVDGCSDDHLSSKNVATDDVTTVA